VGCCARRDADRGLCAGQLHAVARFWNGAVAAQRTATNLTPAVLDANLYLRRAGASFWTSELHTFAAGLGLEHASAQERR
jgi:hypothetical protein